MVYAGLSKWYLRDEDQGSVDPCPSLKLSPPTPNAVAEPDAAGYHNIMRVGRGAWGEGRDLRSLALPPKPQNLIIHRLLLPGDALPGKALQGPRPGLLAQVAG